MRIQHMDGVTTQVLIIQPLITLRQVQHLTVERVSLLSQEMMVIPIHSISRRH